MADDDDGYTPNYGAGAPGKATPTHRSYYDYMTSAFLDHFNGLPARLNAGEEPPRTLDPDRYYDDYDSNQSSTCARLAVEFYNQQQGNSPISLQRAKDSHKFFNKWTAYFHVNFKAAFDGGSGPCYTFFAEVKGPGVPESVTTVVQFHTKEERRTRDNCLYCTGLSHPEQGGFVGHRRLPHHQDPAAAAGEGNDDEEGGGDGDDGDKDGNGNGFDEEGGGEDGNGNDFDEGGGGDEEYQEGNDGDENDQEGSDQEEGSGSDEEDGSGGDENGN